MSIVCFSSLLVNSLLTSVILFLPCFLCCVQSRASEPAGETESLEDESTGRVCQSSGQWWHKGESPKRGVNMKG